MKKRLLTAVGLVAGLAIPVGGAYAAAPDAAPTTGVTITRPQNNDTVVNTRLQITGTAPAGVLVSVSVVDASPGRTGILHQPNGRVDGSVTSDSDGLWVFIPQVKIVPGDFDARASYTTAANQAIDSTEVRFVVVNTAGESTIASISWRWKLGVPMVVLLLIAAIVVVVKRRRAQNPGVRGVLVHRPLIQLFHRAEVQPPQQAIEPASRPLFMNTAEGRSYQLEQAKKIQAMSDEMRGIQRAIGAAAETLERSNSTIEALGHDLRNELAHNTPDPEVDPTEPEATRAGP